MSDRTNVTALRPGVKPDRANAERQRRRSEL
jgi:hypothetical protein